MVALNIAIGMFIGMLIWYITGWWYSISTILGLAVWSTLFLLTDLVNMFFVEIAEFTGAVIINQFKHDAMPKDSATAIDALEKQAESVREVSAGYHGKWPWERVDPIDLRRHIVVTSTIKAYTKNNIEVSVEWVATLTPLRGRLVNYQRWTEEARKAYFEGAFQAHIIAIIKTMDEEELFGQITDSDGKVKNGVDVVKNKFKSIFGGKDTTDPEEDRYGTFTNDPTIKRIERSEKYSRAAESVKIAHRTSEAIKELTRDGKIDYRLAAAAVLGSQDITTVKTLQFLAKVEGLERLQTLVAGGMENVMGEEEKKKKGGK